MAKKAAKKLTKKKKASMARTAKRKALENWSKTIRENDSNTCAICGKKENLNAHHLLNKSKFPQYMLEIECGITLCPICHQFGKFAAETNAVFFAAWLMENRPAQWAWTMQKNQYELALQVAQTQLKTLEKSQGGN